MLGGPALRSKLDRIPTTKQISILIASVYKLRVPKLAFFLVFIIFVFCRLYE